MFSLKGLNKIPGVGSFYYKDKTELFLPIHCEHTFLFYCRLQNISISFTTVLKTGITDSVFWSMKCMSKGGWKIKITVMREFNCKVKVLRTVRHRMFSFKKCGIRRNYL